LFINLIGYSNCKFNLLDRNQNSKSSSYFYNQIISQSFQLEHIFVRDEWGHLGIDNITNIVCKHNMSLWYFEKCDKWVILYIMFFIDCRGVLIKLKRIQIFKNSDFYLFMN